MIPSDIELVEIPESIIVDAAQSVGGVDNSFYILLNAARRFRFHGLTPVFLATKDHSRFTVTSEETRFPQKLH